MKGGALALGLALLSGCAAPTTAPRTAADALRPYYATRDDALRVAPPGLALDAGRALTRIAFGSCDQQNRP
ncbi:MAG: hypothetical protein AVDCRST_MAG91-896 [uncultured Sphingomonadaceae bacterium]|uniref:Uncharacterized protein n=1 Tax=uncultured Sphingomonadaceae bacterium TaxID=169976 RepID=A0A6J4SNT4_9SPHN|nr:MAG: hypothetical protein AVDCRST_MAG91-896 [uncultured Sphingomonadaceae bacterium]